MVDMQHVSSMRIHRDVVTAVSLSPDGQTLYSGSQVRPVS